MNDTIKHFKQSEIYKKNNWITYFLFIVLSSLDDPEKRDEITMEEARQMAERREVVSYLQKLGEGILMIEAIDEYPTVKDSLNEWIWEVAGGLWGRETKKTLIKNSGLPLIGFYLTELMQWIGSIHQK